LTTVNRAWLVVDQARSRGWPLEEFERFDRRIQDCVAQACLSHPNLVV
jgi:hypothetical protein